MEDYKDSIDLGRHILDQVNKYKIFQSRLKDLYDIVSLHLVKKYQLSEDSKALLELFKSYLIQKNRKLIESLTKEYLNTLSNENITVEELEVLLAAIELINRARLIHDKLFNLTRKLESEENITSDLEEVKQDISIFTTDIGSQESKWIEIVKKLLKNYRDSDQ